MILVTGATGFLGSELVRQLHSQGKQVRAIRREHSVVPAILQDISDIEWVDADLLDYFSLEKAFEDITHVYHCAAVVSFQKRDRKMMLRINQEGTAHIVNLCLEKGVDKLVHVSSVAALGEAKKGELTNEKNHWELNHGKHGYAVSKYESEMEVWRGIAEGLNAVIVNPSVIIGENAGTKGSGQIFEMVRSGLSFYTDGSCGLVDVEDVARIMILLMDSDIQSERVIINAANMSFRELFKQAAECFGKKAPQFRARTWMLEIAWRAARLASLLTGKRYGLTKDTARSSLNKMAYSTEKLHRLFPGFTFKPVTQSIREICTVSALEREAISGTRWP